MREAVMIPPDVVVSIAIPAAVLIAFATWMLVQRDADHVPWWHGIFYVATAPLVVVMHIIGAPIFAFATIHAAWERHVRKYRGHHEGNSILMSTWQPGDDRKW